VVEFNGDSRGRLHISHSCDPSLFAGGVEVCSGGSLKEPPTEDKGSLGKTNFKYKSLTDLALVAFDGDSGSVDVEGTNRILRLRPAPKALWWWSGTSYVLSSSSDMMVLEIRCMYLL